MKRTIALLLALMMLLSLCACSSDKAAPKDEEGAVNSGFDIPEVPQEKDEAEVDTDADVQVDGAPVKGTKTGNVYSSAYAKTTFTLPDGWRFYSDEEIAQALGLGMDLIDADDFQKQLAEQSLTYDMMAADALGNNISIAYENLGLTGLNTLTEESYLALLKQQLVQQTSIQYTIGEERTMTLNGNMYTGLDVVGNAGSVITNQRYYLRKMGDYMYIIIISVTNNTTLDAVEACLS